MECLMDSKVWGEKYISNPFAYLEEDVTKIGDKDFSFMKKCFFNYYKKYQGFKELNFKELPYVKSARNELLSRYEDPAT